MANTSRDSFDATKKYRKVLFQQVTDLLDFELNELQDIAEDQRARILETLAEGATLIGSAGYVLPDGGTPKGVLVAGGLAVDNGEAILIPDTSGLVVYTLASVGQVNACVYVEWWDAEIDSGDDAGIYDATFGETAVRMKRNVEVKAVEGQVNPPAADPGRNIFKLAQIDHDFDTFGSALMLAEISHEAAALSPGELAGMGPARTLALTSAVPDGGDGYTLNTLEQLTGGIHTRLQNQGADILTVDYLGNLVCLSVNGYDMDVLEGRIAALESNALMKNVATRQVAVGEIESAGMFETTGA